MKNSDITMTGPFGFNAHGDSSVVMEADNVYLTTDPIVYGDNNAHVDLLVKKSGIIQGNVIANGSSNISIGPYGNSKWSGSSVKNDRASVQVSLEDEAAWYVKIYSITPTQDQSSVISHLQVKGGIIDLGSSQEYQKLSIDKLTGNGGTFHVKTDIQADSTDQIVIGNGTGTHQLQVQATGAEPNREAMDSFIVQQHTGDASFSLANAGGKVEHGLYFYELADRKGDGGQEWYLKRVVPTDPDVKPGTPTGQAEASLSGLAGHYAMWYDQLTDLRKRLGKCATVFRLAHGFGGLPISLVLTDLPIPASPRICTAAPSAATLCLPKASDTAGSRGCSCGVHGQINMSTAAGAGMAT